MVQIMMASPVENSRNLLTTRGSADQLRTTQQVWNHHGINNPTTFISFIAELIKKRRKAIDKARTAVYHIIRCTWYTEK